MLEGCLERKGDALVDVVDERGPVLDGAGEVAGVDVAEALFAVGPGVFGIVNLETDVWRDPFGLDARKMSFGTMRRR